MLLRCDSNTQQVTSITFECLCSKIQQLNLNNKYNNFNNFKRLIIKTYYFRTTVYRSYMCYDIVQNTNTDL